jgi:exopolysaccharide biosynthesis protein
VGEEKNKMKTKYLYLIISFLACTIFLSCRTSPINREAGFVLIESETIETISPFWESFNTGIEYTEGIIASAKMRFYGLKIDLQNPAVEIVVNDQKSKTGIIPSIKTTSFAETYNCIAAINTNPFNTVSANEGIPLTVVGLTISNGVLISHPNENYAALVFYKNRKPEILWQKDLESLDEIENAVGGFFVSLKNGQFQEDISDFRKSVRHPRSAAGLSADGRFLYLLAIDGRTLSSAGATEKETAHILQIFGADNAIIFDGGGSTCLALKYPDGKVRAVNNSVHMNIPGYERAVATCLGIRIKTNP